MTHYRLLCWVGICGILLGGCGQGDRGNGSGPEGGGGDSGVEGAANGSGSEEASGGYLDAMSDAMNRARSVSDLGSLKQAIQTFQATEGRLPKSLQEVVSEGYIRELPEVPNGESLSYDPSSGQVSIEGE